LKTWKDLLHPLNAARLAGFVDGTTLILLFFVAMPLKYWAGLPLAVTIVGSVHGFVFILYLIAVLYAQLRLQWHVKWTLFAVLAGFVPFANYVLNVALAKRRDEFEVKPIPKIWLVYAIVFFTFIDLFTQLPVMSTFAASLGATAMLAGFAVGMYSLSNMAGNVLAGRLTDKYGAYKVLSAGLLLTAVALLLYQIVNNVAALLAVRFLHGLLGGLITPAAFTYVANETRREKQGSRTAITGSFVGMAAIIGPAYSGIMASRFSVPFVFTTVAVAGFGLFLLTVQVLRTGRTVAKEKKTPPRLKLSRGLLQAFASAFFLMVSQGALAYLLPLHVDALGYGSRLAGTLLSMFGIVAVTLFLLPTNRMFDRRPPDLIAFAGLAILGLCQLLRRPDGRHGGALRGDGAVRRRLRAPVPVDEHPAHPLHGEGKPRPRLRRVLCAVFHRHGGRLLRSRPHSRFAADAVCRDRDRAHHLRACRPCRVAARPDGETGNLRGRGRAGKPGGPVSIQVSHQKKE